MLLRPGTPDPEGYTDVYLPPFTYYLHGIGPEAAPAIERELAALEQESADRSESGVAADLVWKAAVERTQHALKCVTRAWRDEKLTVHDEIAVRPTITTFSRLERER